MHSLTLDQLPLLTTSTHSRRCIFSFDQSKTEPPTVICFSSESLCVKDRASNNKLAKYSLDLSLPVIEKLKDSLETLSEEAIVEELSSLCSLNKGLKTDKSINASNQESAIFSVRGLLRMIQTQRSDIDLSLEGGPVNRRSVDVQIGDQSVESRLVLAAVLRSLFAPISPCATAATESRGTESGSAGGLVVVPTPMSVWGRKSLVQATALAAVPCSRVVCSAAALTASFLTSVEALGSLLSTLGSLRVLVIEVGEDCVSASVVSVEGPLSDPLLDPLDHPHLICEPPSTEQFPPHMDSAEEGHWVLPLMRAVSIRVEASEGSFGVGLAVCDQQLLQTWLQLLLARASQESSTDSDFSEEDPVDAGWKSLSAESRECCLLALKYYRLGSIPLSHPADALQEEKPKSLFGFLSLHCRVVLEQCPSEVRGRALALLQEGLKLYGRDWAALMAGAKDSYEGTPLKKKGYSFVDLHQAELSVTEESPVRPLHKSKSSSAAQDWSSEGEGLGGGGRDFPSMDPRTFTSLDSVLCNLVQLALAQNRALMRPSDTTTAYFPASPEDTSKGRSSLFPTLKIDAVLCNCEGDSVAQKARGKSGVRTGGVRLSLTAVEQLLVSRGVLREGPMNAAVFGVIAKDGAFRESSEPDALQVPTHIRLAPSNGSASVRSSRFRRMPSQALMHGAVCLAQSHSRLSSPPNRSVAGGREDGVHVRVFEAPGTTAAGSSLRGIGVSVCRIPRPKYVPQGDSQNRMREASDSGIRSATNSHLTTGRVLSKPADVIPGRWRLRPDQVTWRSPFSRDSLMPAREGSGRADSRCSLDEESWVEVASPDGAFLGCGESAVRRNLSLKWLLTHAPTEDNVQGSSSGGQLSVRRCAISTGVTIDTSTQLSADTAWVSSELGGTPIAVGRQRGSRNRDLLAFTDVVTLPTGTVRNDDEPLPPIILRDCPVTAQLLAYRNPAQAIIKQELLETNKGGEDSSWVLAVVSAVASPGSLSRGQTIPVEVLWYVPVQLHSPPTHLVPATQNVVLIWVHSVLQCFVNILSAFFRVLVPWNVFSVLSSVATHSSIAVDSTVDSSTLRHPVVLPAVVSVSVLQSDEPQQQLSFQVREVQEYTPSSTTPHPLEKPSRRPRVPPIQISYFQGDPCSLPPSKTERDAVDGEHEVHSSRRRSVFGALILLLGLMVLCWTLTVNSLTERWALKIILRIDNRERDESVLLSNLVIFPPQSEKNTTDALVKDQELSLSSSPLDLTYISTGPTLGKDYFIRDKDTSALAAPLPSLEETLPDSDSAREFLVRVNDARVGEVVETRTNTNVLAPLRKGVVRLVAVGRTAKDLGERVLRLVKNGFSAILGWLLRRKKKT